MLYSYNYKVNLRILVKNPTAARDCRFKLDYLVYYLTEDRVLFLLALFC